MAKMKEIGVAVLGFGTVGAGVVETLAKNGDLLAERLGVRLLMRSTRRIVPTREGEAFYEDCVRLLGEWEPRAQAIADHAIGVMKKGQSHG